MHGPVFEGLGGASFLDFTVCYGVIYGTLHFLILYVVFFPYREEVKKEYCDIILKLSKTLIVQ